MTVIKPRTRGRQYVRHRTRLEHDTNETLYAYAAFIGESTEYVLNQLIDTVLAKDKEYLAWRSEHPESCTRRAGRVRGGPRAESATGQIAASSDSGRTGHARN
jgi:hypothetical protein